MLDQQMDGNEFVEWHEMTASNNKILSKLSLTR